MADDGSTQSAASAGQRGRSRRELSERELAAKKRIEDLRMRLLDLTNSNRLLNYRFSARSRRQIRLVDELPDQILRKLLEDKAQTFVALPEAADEPADEKADEFLMAVEQAKRSDEEFAATVSKLEGLDGDDAKLRKAERRLKDRVRAALGMPARLLRDEMSLAEWARLNDIAPDYDLPKPNASGAEKPSHTDNKLQTLLLPDDMERVLSGIYEQAKSSIQETGVNTLYLALGFLEWYEAQSSEKAMFAPLLLHPIEIERKVSGGKYRYSIESLDDEVQINITLSERLHSDFHRRLPEFGEEDTPEKYFEKVAAAIKDVPRWRVRRFAVVGHFAFARLVMFHDLAEGNWAEGLGVIANQVIAKLFAGAGEPADSFHAEEYEVDQPGVAAKVPFHVKDADSSQFSAMVDAMDGKNLVIKGPPGTGKSQTITNIIAAALAGAKTVLFVAEKMAALNVVKARLEEASLGHFCLELHSTKARKKDVLAALDKRLDIQNRLKPKGDLSAAIRELNRTRGQLSDYVATINRPFGAIGRTLHDVLWAEQRKRMEARSLPTGLDSVELANVSQMTRYDLDGLKDRAGVLAQAYREISEHGGFEQHPWRGVGNPRLDFFERERLVSTLGKMRTALEELMATLRRVEEEVEDQVEAQRWDGIAEITAFAAALARLPAAAPGIDGDLYVTLGQPEHLANLEIFADQQERWLDLSRKIGEFGGNPEALATQSDELRALVAIAEAVTATEITIADLPKTVERLETEAARADRAVALGRRVAGVLGVDGPLTVATLRQALGATRVAASLAPELRSLRRPKLFEDGAETTLNDARAHVQRLSKSMALVAERLNVSLDGDPQEWRLLAQTLRTAGLLSGIFSSAVRTAKRKYAGMMRSPAKAKAAEMAADFDVIAECNSLARSLATQSELQEVCGPQFRGYETKFEPLILVAAFGARVKSLYTLVEPLSARVRHVLLEGPSDALEALTSFAGDPDFAATEAWIAGAGKDQDIVVEIQKRLAERAAQAKGLATRCGALGLSAALRIGAIADAAATVAARAEAARKIDADGEARAILGTRWRGPRTDRNVVLNAIAAAKAVNGAAVPLAIRGHLFHPDRDERIARLRPYAVALATALDALASAWKEAQALGVIDEDMFLGNPLKDCGAEALAKRLADAGAHETELTQWVSYLVARHDCVDAGLGGVLAAFGGRAPQETELVAAVDRVFWRTLAREALAANPSVGRFRGMQLDKARARFRSLDEEILRLQRSEIAAQLCQAIVQAGIRGTYQKDYTGRALIEREIQKQKRHIPIRELLDRAGLAVQQMKPCFMMSPLSVAQFLKPNGLRFDLVVIDEASQMRPEEALGALARGGQLVVVGDPMQLPPTSFFDRADRTDDDIDEEEIVDNESILDLALTEFQPARELRWHYRSRHESLIAFSNRRFYDDQLIVFPSPLDPERDKRTPKLGVYHHFVGGTYKGQVNLVEARAVAEAAVAFMAEEPDRSLGIVTLNIAQRDVLLDEMRRLIPREAAAAAYVERWKNTLEEFFVKNLENVQGDERDVIFISTVYGPDPTTGAVMNRFGPINGVHGHRRLNVLFTRAKDRVEVFTSMHPGDIKAGEGAQPGAHALKAYLEYAETGRLDAGEDTGREPDSDFERHVRARLREHGYEVVPQVGVAGYFIDLAVKHPHRSGYLIGIECDGATYHSARSARDRDRLRQQVLESLKWNIYRIWSTDWFHNPDQEMQRLVSHMGRLIEEEGRLLYDVSARSESER